MTSLADRILGALALQPMTVAQLAKCLSASETAVRATLDELNAQRIGSTRPQTRLGRPVTQYGAPA